MGRWSPAAMKGRNGIQMAALAARPMLPAHQRKEIKAQAMPAEILATVFSMPG